MKMNKTVTVILAFTCCAALNTLPPEQAAEAFLKDLNVAYTGKPNCTKIDTDNDGYVTCTVSLPATDRQPAQFLSLQCAAAHSEPDDGCSSARNAQGCKPTQPTIKAVQAQ